MGRALWAAMVLTVAAIGLSPQLRAQFATGVQLVEVYATVTRPDGTRRDGPDGLRLRGAARTAWRSRSPCSRPGSFPLTVALGVDRSLSMAGEPLRLAMRASQAFLRALKPQDRSMVWAIADGAEVIAPLDAPRDEQLLALAKLTPWSTTALHDSVIAALDRLEPERGRQALVLFTDGADRYSRCFGGRRARAGAAQQRARLRHRRREDACTDPG